ncbi:MAG TPA: septation protein SepH [Jiangellaceae bacterium]|nr:septation protein SepH [Jiangellaceae bacterium]
MRKLRLVAMSDDGMHLILHADGDETPMSLPLDERLHAALRGDRARLGQLEIQMDSQLRPRDIQARVRSGESVQSVAAAAGVPLDRVLRFAGPVLAEREHIAGRAQQAIIRRISNESPNRPLQETVAEWVSSYDIDPETVAWDAWRRDDGRWIVSARWPSQQDEKEARFTFDPTGRSVVPDNDEARAVAGERAQVEPEPVVEPPVPTGPARLSVVSDPDDEPIIVDGPGVVEPGDDAVEYDNEPTVPVPITAQRAQYDARRLHPERRSSDRDDRPDPWSRDSEEPTSDRLRLSDIASRIEVEETPPQRPVAARAASGDVAPAQPDEPAPPRAKRSRSKRPSVPSWDEIMFGRRDKSE